MTSTLQQTSTSGGRIIVAEGGALLIEHHGEAPQTRDDPDLRVARPQHLAAFFDAKRLDRIGGAKSTGTATGKPLQRPGAGSAADRLRVHAHR